MIEADTALSLDLPLAELGGEVRILATGSGDVDGPVATSVTLGGTSVRPLAPVHLRWREHGAGAVQIPWVRRSRNGWRWSDGIDVPIGEEREVYRLTLVRGDGGVRSFETVEPSVVIARDVRTGGRCCTWCRSARFGNRRARRSRCRRGTDDGRLCIGDQTSTRLGLPLLQAGQAQKELTHNEALTLLDLAVQPSVEAIALDTPPADPAPDACWIVGTVPTVAWTGQAQALAGWTDSGWRFVPSRPGMTMWSKADQAEARFDGTRWTVGTIVASPLVLGGLRCSGHGVRILLHLRTEAWWTPRRARRWGRF
nr:DUF2793 domain-containing protein [Sphingomonas glacialis]